MGLSCANLVAMKLRPLLLGLLGCFVLTACPEPVPVGWTMDFRGGTVNVDNSFLGAANQNTQYRQLVETQLEKYSSLKVQLSSTNLQSVARPQASAAVGVSFYMALRKDGLIPAENASLEFQGPQKPYSYVGNNNQPTQPIYSSGEAWFYSQIQSPQGTGTYRARARVAGGVVSGQTEINLAQILALPNTFEAAASPDGVLAANWDNLPNAKSYLALLVNRTTNTLIWAGVVTKNQLELLEGLPALNETQTYDLTVSAFNFDINLSPKNPIPKDLEANVNSSLFRRNVTIGKPALQIEYKNKQFNGGDANRLVNVVLSGKPNASASAKIDLFNSGGGAMKYSLELPQDSGIEVAGGTTGAIRSRYGSFQTATRQLELKTTCGANESDRLVKAELKTNTSEPSRTIFIQVECLRDITATEAWKQEAGMSSPNALALSPQGNLLLGSGQEGVRMWDVATGKIVFSIGISAATFNQPMAWKPDGSQFLIILNDQVKIYDTLTKNIISTFSLSFSGNYVHWSPDGSRLLIGGTREARLYNAITGAFILQFTSWIETSSSSTVAAWSPDGTKVGATGEPSNGNNAVVVWNASTGLVERRFEVDNYVRGIAWNADGSQIATGYKNQVRIWNINTNLELPAINIQGNTNNALQLLGWDSGNQKFWVRASGEKITTRNATDGSQIQEFPESFYFSLIPTINKIAIRTTSVFSNALTITIFDTNTAQQAASVSSASGNINKLLWSPDSSRFAVLSGTSAKVYSKAGVVLGELPFVNGFFWSRDGTQYLTSDGATLQFRDATTGLVLRSLAIGAAINQIVWNADGNLIAIQESLRVRVLNQATGAEIWRLEDARAVSTNPSGTKLILSVGSGIPNPILRVYNFAVGSLESTLNTDNIAGFLSPNWGPSESRAASFGGVAGGIVRVFNLQENFNLELNTSFQSIANLQWDATGRRIFATGIMNQSSLTAYSAISGEPLVTLTNLVSNTFLPSQRAISPDGTAIVQTFDQSGLKLWNLIYAP